MNIAVHVSYLSRHKKEPFWRVCVVGFKLLVLSVKLYKGDARPYNFAQNRMPMMPA